jgi:hypothetical protein
MSLRKALVNEVRNLAYTKRIEHPKLNSTSLILNTWLDLHRVNPEILKEQRREKKRRKRRKKIKELRNNKQFNELLQLILSNERYSNSESEKIITAMRDDGKYTIKINNLDFPLNDSNKDFLKKFMMEGEIISEIEDQGSDRLYRAVIDGITSIEVIKMETTVNAPDQDGAYFPRLNNADKKDSKSLRYINLTRYQIFAKSQSSENCLIHTLSLIQNISPEEINQIKLSLTSGAYIAKKNFKFISQILNKTILLHYQEVNETRNKVIIQKFGDYEESIHIAIYMNHYFIYEETKYTKYSINNYHTINDKKEWWNFYKKEERSNSKSKLSSLNLIHLMNSKSFFILGDMSNSEEASSHIDIRDEIFLDNIDNEQRLIEIPELIENNSDIYYADFETFTGGEFHEMFLLGCVSKLSDIVKIWNIKNYSNPQYLIYEFLKMLTSDGTKDATCYFHNLKYDFSIMEKLLNISSVCKKNNQLYNVVCYYKNKKVEFRDSYKLASMPLSDFQKNFNLDNKFNKLEAINYNFYTKENNNKMTTRTIYSKGLTEEQTKILYERVKTEKFNATDYYIEYLKMDCLVLKKGLEKFNEIILNLDVRLSLYNSLTISSLTDKYMLINGAYEDVYENTANLRDYIGKAIYGGRVHVNEKYTKKIINEKIADYDGVSLYPSAISRLCSELGLPKGKCKRYDDPTIQSNYAIYSIKINKVNKKQQMPFIAVKSEDSLDYVNKPPLGVIQIDSTTLEDYIKFHEIEYEILDGVYWDEGGNSKMGELVDNLFKLRLENKTLNPALANILKLMLNSAYGKTIMKKSTSKTRIIKKDKITLNDNKEWEIEENKNYQDFIYKNFNTLKSSRKINAKLYEVDQLCIDDSYNRGHIGCAILSMSKRIMNEVFDICNTHKIKTFYQDTDSIHMLYNDVPKLEKEFNIKYDRDLTGSQLGQFHNDFELEGVKKINGVSGVYSTKSIFLGKKSYIDCLEGLDKDGNTISGYHIRLKGITREAIKHHGEDKPFEMFKKLANNESMTMILNPENSDGTNAKPSFEFLEGSVRSRKSNSFTRTICF